MKGGGWARLGMCSVDRGNVFSFLPDVFSFRANVSSFRPNVFTFGPDVFSEEVERGEGRAVRVGVGGWGSGVDGRRDSPFDRLRAGPFGRPRTGSFDRLFGDAEITVGAGRRRA